ncbi:hypothetical protein PPERSA_08543 [Pseudocohnilembus persalinus]|uniref:Transmembrane protein n=1 Tax=Pseudocohnilembus persalinus TaxID=266149 RepID=A0A0V0R6N6_PSEPJ|nr:hypothetical protein PPERSA_08543 [Pseudocohnilembus persalinus]|eukprot:KRX10140.1 hypothetical protein PPERSA_08543 [Pseudocohnilembus persalinus]
MAEYIQDNLSKTENSHDNSQQNININNNKVNTNPAEPQKPDYFSNYEKNENNNNNSNNNNDLQKKEPESQTCSQKLEEKLPTQKEPCFYKSKLFTKICEQSSFCLFSGKIGVDFFSKNRGIVFTLDLALQILATIFTAFSLFAFVNNHAFLSAFNWAKGDIYMGGQYQAYYGLLGFNIYSQQQDINKNIKWGGAECELSYCIDCKEQALANQQTAVIAFITSIPSIMTILQRAKPETDKNCQKFMGILTSITGFTSGFISLYNYYQYCIQNISHLEVGGNFSIKQGPGYSLLFIATVLKIFDLFCHLLVPTPPNINRKSQIKTIRSELKSKLVTKIELNQNGHSESFENQNNV